MKLKEKNIYKLLQRFSTVILPDFEERAMMLNGNGKVLYHINTAIQINKS